MANLTDRERGFEAKYSFDLERDFRIEAHLYKMLALWAGEKMGMSEAESRAYAAKVVGDVVTNPQENGVVAVLLAEFGRHKIDMTVSELTSKLEQLRPIARAELLGE
ncbi:DUF1476 domain-containing protein [Thalassospira alkalitolerans]|uniref:Aldolase n=1 Tax=Thalassospira alkalitolerans TaxID=1293890 RepID=A0A1Y2LFB4_9PROT|nr:ATPase inhibitor subunit zeta [Thalassospira alkalitolerans]OSQ49676.1 hypothetical protein TALK_05000 [Thalassospira alkalitolerans]|tara:strand:- start:78511 stop:78831 length:321 start_codon:yes stop_codon:yes gene_type:complete